MPCEKKKSTSPTKGLALGHGQSVIRDYYITEAFNALRSRSPAIVLRPAAREGTSPRFRCGWTYLAVEFFARVCPALPMDIAKLLPPDDVYPRDAPAFSDTHIPDTSVTNQILIYPIDFEECSLQ